MRQIYKVMSDMLLPGFVCAMLLALLGGMSLLPHLGEYMNVPQEEYAAYQDIKQTQIACERQSPQIVRNGAGNWRPGEKIPVEQVFCGIDAEGKDTQVRVLKIQDENGNNRMDCYDRAEHKLEFPTQGAYFLELQSIDMERKPAVKRFILLVDHRQGGI